MENLLDLGLCHSTQSVVSVDSVRERVLPRQWLTGTHGNPRTGMDRGLRRSVSGSLNSRRLIGGRAVLMLSQNHVHTSVQVLGRILHRGVSMAGGECDHLHFGAMHRIQDGQAVVGGGCGDEGDRLSVVK